MARRAWILQAGGTVKPNQPCRHIFPQEPSRNIYEASSFIFLMNENFPVNLAIEALIESHPVDRIIDQ
jgi:hypothetical protein